MGDPMLHSTGISQKRSKVEMDLASLASQAAIALDELALGRRTELTAITELVQKVQASLPSHQSIDVPTAVAVQRALVALPEAAHGTTVNELLDSASELTKRLSNLVANDEHQDIEEIKRLRSFCVALSRSAMSLEGSPYDRPEHPFKH